MKQENITPNQFDAPASAPQPESTPPTLQDKPNHDAPSKPKALIATAIICAILAVAGIAFGIYGMFFQPQPKCETNCIQPSENNSNTNEDEPSSDSSTLSPVSTEQATTLLDEKYGFEDEQKVIFDGWHNYIKDFNQANKILFTIYHLKDKLGTAQPTNDYEPVVVYNINFDDFETAYKYYFGNEEPLEKKDYELDGVFSKIQYNANDDSFNVYSKNGLGGTTSIAMLRKVLETIGTEKGFKAIVATVTINEVVTQDKNGFLGESGDGQGNMYYSIGMSEDAVEEIRDSLSVYEFNFIKENDDYKLTAITKL
ncbi:hypothetical protein IKF30_01660 [Candidatus Saccharibacteria bacterium]|nr:hypothetical protein [Candidatus Saccharibacteria bacterium]